MRKNNIFLLTSAFVLLFSGCLKEEELEGSKPVTLEPMTFHASMESGADTKTVIEGNVGDDVRYLKWLPEDKIGVYNAQTRKFETFVNVNEETSATAVFEGVNSVQDVYYAVYPYSELHSYAEGDKIMTVDLPTVQEYSEDSFGIDANPMVALAGKGEKFFFQNLCGVLVINITGEASVKSLSVTLFDDSGNPAAVSGKHTVSMDYIESPTLASTEESQKSVTLDCGDGVTLNASEPTPFHLVLPAGTYSGITVSVLTTDGGIMVKHGKNSLRIRRSRVTSAGEFHYQSEIAVDLSERGTANCYVVSDPGVYSFDATVIGNGEFGLVPDAGFHTDNPEINPTSVELLWEDASGVIQSVFYKDGRICFYSSGIEGNALLAAKDASGTIVWSWHIWVTDEPEEHKYENLAGTFMVLDRNLGATRSDRGTGDEWKEGKGVVYQWGRKDPIVAGRYTLNDTAWEQFSISESIQTPTRLPYANSNWDWWMTPENNKLWSSVQKTIYDPCPMGYKVPHKDIWNGFVNENGALNVSGGFDNGWYFIVNDDVADNLAWYPANDYIGYSGRYYYRTSEIDFWHSTPAYSFHIDESKIDFSWFNTSNHSTFSSLHVRCMKDDGYVDISLPQVEILEISDITTSSAKVVVNVKSPGISEVTEKGIIWGTMSDLSDGIRVECGSGNEDFTVNLTGFEKASKYYVRPYAKSKRGEAYGPVKVLTTLYLDGIVNLSSNGTSNCYQIIPQYAVASIDCSVKGNSDESVGDIFSLEVLWETDSFMRKAELGTILKSVRLENNTAIITLSDDTLEGNALIAAKDESGVILWSWHIWVTDTPEDHVYKANNSSWVVQDRHLGATRGDYSDGDDWKESCGIDYQWGRKDPISSGNFTIVDDVYTVERAVQNPTVLAKWERADGLWSPDVKTMYDPCPVGYMVASKEVYECLQPSNIDVSNGCYFIYDGLNTAWYPFRGYPGQYGDIAYWGDNYMWCTTMVNTCIYYSDGHISTSNYVQHGNTQDRSPVRCMKE